jgi:hypothetical protein
LLCDFFFSSPAWCKGPNCALSDVEVVLLEEARRDDAVLLDPEEGAAEEAEGFGSARSGTLRCGRAASAATVLDGVLAMLFVLLFTVVGLGNARVGGACGSLAPAERRFFVGRTGAARLLFGELALLLALPLLALAELPLEGAGAVAAVAAERGRSSTGIEEDAEADAVGAGERAGAAAVVPGEAGVGAGLAALGLLLLLLLLLLVLPAAVDLSCTARKGSGAAAEAAGRADLLARGALCFSFP